jgi:hypothetical protein
VRFLEEGRTSAPVPAYPHLQLLMQSSDWTAAHPKAREYLLGLRGSGGDLPLTEWTKELEQADRFARRGLSLAVTRDALGREVGEEDLADDPEEA